MKFQVTLLPNGDKLLPYNINVEATNTEEAVMKAKNAIASYGYFGMAKKEAIIRSLKVQQIRKI